MREIAEEHPDDLHDPKALWNKLVEWDDEVTDVELSKHHKPDNLDDLAAFERWAILCKMHELGDFTNIDKQCQQDEELVERLGINYLCKPCRQNGITVEHWPAPVLGGGSSDDDDSEVLEWDSDAEGDNIGSTDETEL
jgi:hypothetical protein